MDKITLTHDELTAMLTEASDRGATKVLARLGLDDEKAAKDLQDLRELLAAWRSARRTVWQTMIKWTTTLFLVFMAAAIGVKTGHFTIDK